ncbi:DNA/RNA helicase domain-containing protein [Massiliimalia massiliensis]|uniref:DNA/RNA helicase domain-containing protein n=1 Tax=Massiliimalia massiliensis TaxID=1852384 RepID=UPI0009860D90|nr:DNA/RNA helicase domain-containing protein [Massiliimalia massiliensis]
MRNLRSYYSATIADFLQQSSSEIIGIIHSNDISAETTIQQSNTWESEVQILKDQLHPFSDGRIIFEYTIPRMGKRVDAVVLYRNIVFLLEFKCGDSEYCQSTYDQVYDYALDLRNFQKESHNKLLVPMMISTHAPRYQNTLTVRDRIVEPIRCNARNIGIAIEHIAEQFNEAPFDYEAWENSEYLPTPTIVEAAQALYRGHNVHDITRSDAGAENLTVTTDEINRIIEHSKANGRKSICFVTGVPGAGKTLVGLNIAIQRSDAQAGEHAVFLSGNFPLVTVLQEALARDKVEQEKQRGNRVAKADTLRSTSAFIQIIHKYRDSFVGNDNVPPERVAIFDEAQRAWTHDMIRKFMRTKKGVPDFHCSEPEFLISTMDRHQDWAVVICLVGGGQEINTGEAGLPEWFDSLKRSFPDWDVYITPQLNDDEYRRGRAWSDMLSGLQTYERDKLHLATSVRSFRTPDLAAFVKAVLDADTDEAKELYQRIKDKYPIVITRDLNKAKAWVREQCQGTTRYGLLASSGALRLKPDGIFVKNEISVANWFLNGKDDVRSSYMLEDVVTEFDIQGLELDYSVVAWDADYRYVNGEWTYNNFVGNHWNNVNSEEKRLYLKNAYRVLLTRARQGMAIFVPAGSDNDQTRRREWYDGIYGYLKEIGIQII